LKKEFISIFHNLLLIIEKEKKRKSNQ